MINVAEITSTKGVEQAQKQMEQAKNRMALEKKKANEESPGTYQCLITHPL